LTCDLSGLAAIWSPAAEASGASRVAAGAAAGCVPPAAGGPGRPAARWARRCRAYASTTAGTTSRPRPVIPDADVDVDAHTTPDLFSRRNTASPPAEVHPSSRATVAARRPRRSTAPPHNRTRPDERASNTSSSNAKRSVAAPRPVRHANIPGGVDDPAQPGAHTASTNRNNVANSRRSSRSG
jgi:hypothetical protein